MRMTASELVEEYRKVFAQIHRMYSNPELRRVCSAALRAEFDEALYPQSEEAKHDEEVLETQPTPG